MTTTDDLIATLAAHPARTRRPGWVLARLYLAVAGVSALFLLVAHPRRDLWAVMGDPVIWSKTLLPAGVSLLAALAARRLMRPEGRAGLRLWPLLVPLAVAAALWGVAFATRAPAARFAEVGVLSLAECLGLIVLLGAAPAWVAISALRDGASVAPRLSAALAGLAAGAGAAAGYSLFCTRDNPLFFVTWYGLAIGIVMLGTACFGTRALRW